MIPHRFFVVNQVIPVHVTLEIQVSSKALGTILIEALEPENQELNEWAQISSYIKGDTVSWAINGKMKLSTLRNTLDSLLKDALLTLRVNDSMDDLS